MLFGFYALCINWVCVLSALSDRNSEVLRKNLNGTLVVIKTNQKRVLDYPDQCPKSSTN